MNTSRSAGAIALLADGIAEARHHGRQDLVERLEAERALLRSGAWNVLVAGEFKKGKSAFVNALVGVGVCSADPVTYTAVPTFVRFAEQPSAVAVAAGDAPPDGRTIPVAAGDAPPDRRTIPVREAAAHAGRGTDGTGAALQAVEVGLPRTLLRSGMTLIDTPGVGGGFGAVQAAATMRAVSLAHAVVVVTDASQELTAAEVEFLRRAAEMCPRLFGVLAKTDLYPDWRRIRDLNRRHLTGAGLDVEILPVSAAVRERALDTNDPRLNAQSGFPLVVRRLRDGIRAHRQGESSRAAGAVRDALTQIAGAVQTEHEVLTRPAQRGATLQRVDVEQQRAQQLSAPSARWLNTLNDRFADLRDGVEDDLKQRLRQLEEEAMGRIRAGDPAKDWAQFVPWLYERTNAELTEVHARLLAQVDRVGADVAALFADSATGVGPAAAAVRLPTPGDTVKLSELSTGRVGRLEIGMQAARGWSLSSSVVTTVLVATLNPGLLVVLPISLVLGSVFALKAVRGYQATRLEAARNEAQRMVGAYLRQAQLDAGRAAQTLLRHSQTGIRDYYLDRAAELTATARTVQEAALRASTTDASTARRRVAESAGDLARIERLVASAERVLG